MTAITEQQGTINGLSFTWLEAGGAGAPLALCQHGFPDTPWGWRWLLPELADAGFHAVAPYARGYAPTEVPAGGISAISGWVADATAFHEELGGGVPGVIVGHDWGALMAYGAASHAPERWLKVVTASVPPTSVMAGRLLDYEQVRAFWYQYVFLQPTAEAIVAHNDLEFIARLWEEWSPGFHGADDLARVKDTLRDPGNLTAALGTYRSMFDLSLQPAEYAAETMAVLTPHPQPTLYLHGVSDGCVPGEVWNDVADVLPEGSRVEPIDGAGHFLQYEQPQLVADLIVGFLSG
ncbi:MAG: alpha/beta hydrolase [Actinobacteria bacterium]|nr:alpha/beta hydrolase [Actinomycetota bacterium]